MSKDFINKYNIDLSRLKRDYEKFPLLKKNGYHLSERPCKEDFVYLFLECNVRRDDLHQYFNVSRETIDNFVKDFGCQKSKKQSHLNGCKTNLQKYGCKDPMQVKKFQNKFVKTIKTKYGVTNVSKLSEVKLKKIQTVKKNKTFVKSKEEDKIYDILTTRYNIVERQHFDNRYPWKCDFYIPEKDLFIEFQGNWVHGPKEYFCHEPYDRHNKIHQKVLKIWNRKAKDRFKQGFKTSKYFDAIQTWTVRDPLKRQTAKNNNLNWIEFFTIEEFTKWFNNH